MESQFLIIVVAFFYFIPWIVALRNSHRHAVGIFLLNLFLGWTFIGWIGALIWAVLPPEKKQSDAEKMLELMRQMKELEKQASAEVAK